MQKRLSLEEMSAGHRARKGVLACRPEPPTELRDRLESRRTTLRQGHQAGVLAERTLKQSGRCQTRPDCQRSAQAGATLLHESLG